LGGKPKGVERLHAFAIRPTSDRSYAYPCLAPFVLVVLGVDVGVFRVVVG